MPAEATFRHALLSILAACVLLDTVAIGRGQTQIGMPSAEVLEAARRTRDPAQIEQLRKQIEQYLGGNPNDALGQYQFALIESYIADSAELRKEKKSAVAAIDKAIDACLRSIQLDEKSAATHSLLADLYGRKISLGTAMFAGPRYGPKVKEQNERARTLDEKDPRVWASTGRQLLMAPKAFGGDVPKAIESLQKSLALDASQDETWVWLARAFQKQGDNTKALGAVQQALQLNPQNPFAKQLAESLRK